MNKEELLSRIKAAIVLLPDGHTLKIGDLSLSCSDKNHLAVKGWTIHNLDSMNKQIALSELQEIKSLFINMVDASSNLKDFINGMQIEFYLGYDYQLGSVGICSEINGEIKWETLLR